MWTALIIITLFIAIICLIFSLDTYFARKNKKTNISTSGKSTGYSKTHPNKRKPKHNRQDAQTISLFLDAHNLTSHSKTDDQSKHRENHNHHHFDSSDDSGADGGSD